MGKMCEGIYVDGLSTAQALEIIDLRYLGIHQEKGHFELNDQVDPQQILHVMITLQVDEVRAIPIQNQLLILVLLKFELSMLVETQSQQIKKTEWHSFLQVHSVEEMEEDINFTSYPLDLRLSLDGHGGVDYFLVYGLEKIYLTDRGYDVRQPIGSLEEELI